MTKNNSRLLAIGAIIILLLLLFWKNVSTNGSLIQSTTLQQIVKNWEIKVCYVQQVPAVTKDPKTNKLSWWMIDLMNSIMQDAELKIKYVETTRWWFAADLNAEKCDVWLSFYPLINRAKVIAFTKPFYYIWNNAIVKKDSVYSNISDLNNANTKVAVIQWEYGQIYAQKFLPKAKLIVLDASADNTAPLVAVSAWQADAGLIMDDVMTEYIRNNDWLRKISKTPYSATPNTMAVRSADIDLLNFLNTSITMKESYGEVELFAKKYKSLWFVEDKKYKSLQ